MVSKVVRSRKVKAMRRLNSQLVNVAKERQYDRAHIGYISALMVHGRVPIPETESLKPLIVHTIPQI